MVERCEWCNHKAPGHDPLCQHAKAEGDVCGPFAPSPALVDSSCPVCGAPENHQHALWCANGERLHFKVIATKFCDACGTTHGFGECPTNYVKRAAAEVVKLAFVPPDPRRPLGLTDNASDRKGTPIATGVIDYFPDALAEVARTSRIGNEQHSPGQPLHWDRSKSTDEADALLRHFVQRGTVDSDGVLHSAKVAWRALALLQKEIEAMRGDKAA